MSGRNLRDFVVSHRNMSQDAEEQKHLVTRALVGMGSNRYRRTDYQEAWIAAQRYRQNADRTTAKVNQMRTRAKMMREKGVTKHHFQIWHDSGCQLEKSISESELSFDHLMVQTVENLKVDYGRVFADEIENSLSESKKEVAKFIKAAIYPVQELMEDVKLRLREIRNRNEHEREDFAETGQNIINEIQSVVSQCFSVGKWLSHQRAVLEDDLTKVSDITRGSSSALSIPPLEKALPVVVMLLFFNIFQDSLNNFSIFNSSNVIQVETFYSGNF